MRKWQKKNKTEKKETRDLTAVFVEKKLLKFSFIHVHISQTTFHVFETPSVCRKEVRQTPCRVKSTNVKPNKPDSCFAD